MLRAAGRRAAPYILTSRTFGRNDARLWARFRAAQFATLLHALDLCRFDRLALERRELAARIDEVDQPLGERLREMDERLGVRNALVSAVGAVGVLRRAGPERVRGAVLPARDASSKATWGRRRPLSDIAVFCPLSENACQSGFGFAT